jgi:hypothetical protein
MDDNNTIEMLRFNPNQDPGDKTLKHNLLPPMETNLENLLQTSNLKMFLGINATTGSEMVFMPHIMGHKYSHIYAREVR